MRWLHFRPVYLLGHVQDTASTFSRTLTLYPVNMPDPIRKRFGWGQLWPLRPACSQNRAGSYRPDRIGRIRLRAPFSVPFFQRRHGPYCAKQTRILSGWPGQGLAKLIWSESKLVCRNHRARFLAGRNRPATSFPLSELVPLFHGCLGQCWAKPARIRFSSG